MKMSPRRDRSRGHKREHSSHGRSENGSGEHPYRNSNEVWSEHMSSSGKKYYYNNVCGISQWDKPSDWIETPQRRNNYYSNREIDPETSEHNSRRYRDSHNYHHESNYREQHFEFRSPRNHHYNNYNDNHITRETENLSGASTPIHEIQRFRPDNQPSLSMVSTLPRNLSHQSSTQQIQPSNNYGSNLHSEHSNRQHSLNSFKSKNDNAQNMGTYRNISGCDLPILTSSLSKYVSNDLTKHVSDWPADVLERQAQKYSEESYVLGNMQCMQVCSELKCARALVRHMEIKATLQDQKMMYLRQQIESIKDIRSQNFITSDET